jgi:hypothetical protein
MKSRLRCSAATRCHRLRAATRGRRPPRGAGRLGLDRHDCRSTPRRPSTRAPVRRRSAAMASSTAATRARSSRRTTAASPSSGGIVSVNVTSSGSVPSAREEVPRPLHGQCPPRQERAQPVHARPVMHPLDEQPGHRVGRRVHQLVHHVRRVHQLDHARRIRRPEVLTPPSQRVHRPRDQAVEVLPKLHLAPVPVVHHAVVMVRHRRRQDELDLVSRRRHRQAVQIRLVGLLVRPQQEFSLHAPPVDHQEPTGQHLPWERHRLGRTSKRLASANCALSQTASVRLRPRSGRSVRHPDIPGQTFPAAPRTTPAEARRPRPRDRARRPSLCAHGGQATFATNLATPDRRARAVSPAARRARR